MEEEMRSQRIPKTDSIEELARFWDAHDVTDFGEELEEVTESVFARRGYQVTIRLEERESETVRRIAATRSIEETVFRNGYEKGSRSCRVSLSGILVSQF